MRRIAYCSMTLALPLLLPAPGQDRPRIEEAREVLADPAVVAGKAAVRAREKAAVRVQEQVEVRGQVLVAPAAPAVMMPGGVPDQLIMQFEQQLRPILRADLHLLRSSCDPTEDERRRLAEAGDRALRKVAEQVAGQQLRPIGPDSRGIDAIALLSRKLAEAAEEVLTADRVAPFRSEVEARDEARTHAAAGLLVAAIDQTVLLAADQRERLREALVADWDPAWFQAVEMLQRGPQYLPRLPEDCLFSVLDETQARIWRARERSNVRFNGIFLGQQIDNVALDDPVAPVGPEEVAPQLNGAIHIQP